MSKRRRPSARRSSNLSFWGSSVADRPLHPIRPTPDPSAVPRSLGDPPLAVNAEVAQRHLAAVYEEAVRTATALAAANGLLADDDQGEEGPGRS